jgi:hypothetical protein
MAFKQILSNKGKERLKILCLEETVQHIVDSEISGDLLEYFLKFNLKYKAG